MKPMYQNRSAGRLESFSLWTEEKNDPLTPYHFHPEYEIILNINCNGTYFIGDHLNNYQQGTLLLLGANLPHSFKPDTDSYLAQSDISFRSVSILFAEDALGKEFLLLEEAAAIRQLLTKSERGIEFYGNTHLIISKKIIELISLKGLLRWMKMMEIVQLLAESKDYRFISRNKVRGSNEKESDRMEEVLRLVMENYSKNISLRDAAAKAGMAENSFSRFFKERTYRKFTAYLNEFRLSQASRLLVETDKTIEEIAHACGYGNLSNFHRQFKRLYHCSPLHYRKKQFTAFAPV